MRASIFLACPIVAVCATCAPDLPAIGSRITAQRVIAVRAEPAEAAPGTIVQWHALVATPAGAVTDAAVHWSFCLAPRSPSDSITLSTSCLGDGVLPDGGTLLQPFANDGHATTSAAIPSDACQRVGPQVPSVSMNAQRQRPPDPDITGGYYLPIRLQLAAQPDSGSVFARTRLACNLTDTAVDVARAFQARYHANQNPALASVSVRDADGDHVLTPDETTPSHVVNGNSAITIVVDWTPESVERFVLVDPVTRQLAERVEQLEVTWFSNGGVFTHERTGSDVADGGSHSSSNTLRLDAAHTGVITVWIVLRDDRGGVAFASFALTAQ